VSAALSPPVSTALVQDLTFPEVEAALVAEGVSSAHARPLFQALHREFSDLATADFPPPLQRWIAANAGRFDRAPAEVSDTRSSDGLTQKFLLRLEDGQTIETVLMGYTGRSTACVSTQAGCAMGCVFCATGQMGFSRHLRPAEIVAQVAHVQRELRARGEPALRNLVLMGMGEPLHNYDAVMTALEIISDNRGLGIGASRITVSTVGVVPGILRMAEERRPFNLAVSLHGATEEERAALVPISARWPLRELIEACRVYAATMRRRIFFAWTLIAGVNDSVAHAERIAELLAGIDAHVNLIPLNPTTGFAGVESGAGDRFQQTLLAAGIPSTFRQRRGIDVAAGCGQLRAEKERRPAKVHAGH